MNRRVAVKKIVVDLLKGFLKDEESRFSYKVRSNYWSVEGNWHPSRDQVLRHLRRSSIHRFASFQQWPLEQLTLPELQSLHSDHHEGRVK